MLDEQRVFDDARVTLRMRGLVAECKQVVTEPARDHVQEDPPAVDVGEGRHHVGDGVGVHVDRLNRHQRAQLFGRLDDDLRDEPRVDDLVVGVDQDAAIPGAIAPRGDIGDAPAILVRWQIPGLWAGGKEL